jgi:hypothetical protein
MLTFAEKSRPIASRIQGRTRIAKRLRSLLLAVHRYGRCRASRTADYRWTASVLDALYSTLAVAESHDGRVLTTTKETSDGSQTDPEQDTELTREDS